MKNTNDLNERIKILVQKEVDLAVEECRNTICIALLKLVDPSIQPSVSNWIHLNTSATKKAVVENMAARILNQPGCGFPAVLWESRTAIKLDAVMSTMNAVQKLLMESKDYVPVEIAPEA